jgi:hypothetical protein
MLPGQSNGKHSLGNHNNLGCKALNFSSFATFCQDAILTQRNTSEKNEIRGSHVNNSCTLIGAD